MRTTRTKRTKTDLKFKFVLANPMTGKVKKIRVPSVIPFYKQIFCGMIEDYHFIYSQWNGLLHICLPEPPSTTPEVMHRKFGLKNPSDVSAQSQGGYSG